MFSGFFDASSTSPRSSIMVSSSSSTFSSILPRPKTLSELFFLVGLSVYNLGMTTSGITFMYVLVMEEDVEGLEESDVGLSFVFWGTVLLASG